jgi:hypothetical protein
VAKQLVVGSPRKNEGDDRGARGPDERKHHSQVIESHGDAEGAEEEESSGDGEAELLLAAAAAAGGEEEVGGGRAGACLLRRLGGGGSVDICIAGSRAPERENGVAGRIALRKDIECSLNVH